MKVSIITVCKNAEKTIARTIEAIAAQTYPNIEYIVIDGKSEDGTAAILEQYRDQITTLVSEADSGIYAAMNKGIALATGEFIYFANADDYLFDAEVIQDLVEFVKQHPDCDCVYGDHQARFVSGDTGIYQPVPPEQMLEEMICLGDNHLHQPTSFFRTTLFSTVGLFNESYRIASDYEWFLRFLQTPGLKLGYCPRTIVSYAHGGASSNIRALFTEVFDIQNETPICQEPAWLAKRIAKLQEMYVDKYDLLERTNQLSLARYADIQHREAQIAHLKAQLEQARVKKVEAMKTQIETLEAETERLNAEITAMKTSKFWKLRSTWFRLKQAIRLPVD
ncbi:MAG: hypothetical protein Kow00121_22270 [Elainellaceae cyanobacterium]